MKEDKSKRCKKFPNCDGCTDQSCSRWDPDLVDVDFHCEGLSNTPDALPDAIDFESKPIIKRCSKCGRRIDREGKVPCSVWFDGLCEDCEPKE